MPEWNTQVIWLQLAVIMILALQSLEAKDNGKKTSPCKTCTLNHDNNKRVAEILDVFIIFQELHILLYLEKKLADIERPMAILLLIIALRAIIRL